MKHVYDLLETKLRDLNREIGRARNCNQPKKAARLPNYRRQVRRAILYLEAHFGHKKGDQKAP